MHGNICTLNLFTEIKFYAIIYYIVKTAKFFDSWNFLAVQYIELLVSLLYITLDVLCTVFQLVRACGELVHRMTYFRVHLRNIIQCINCSVYTCSLSLIILKLVCVSTKQVDQPQGSSHPVPKPRTHLPPPTVPTYPSREVPGQTSPVIPPKGIRPTPPHPTSVAPPSLPPKPIGNIGFAIPRYVCMYI